MSEVNVERENRYIVIKRSDLEKVPVSYRRSLADPMFTLLSHLPRRECLVIESDWPEYEPTWHAIERRMTGQPADDFGAQRLRADTAEAELKLVRESHESMRADLIRTDAKLTAAKQRIAELVRLMTDIVHNYNHGYIREMHRAIVNADAALNPNPEAESHES